MEGRSSFKECPRCGLRNRLSATKCDFCGYEFKGSSEEWSDYVDILEKLSKGDEVRPVDEDLSKKIESTLVKKRDVEEVMVEGSAAAAGIAVIGGRESIEEDQIVTEVDEPKEVVEFVDSMIEDDTSEPISRETEEPTAEVETTEGASLEYLEELISDESEAIPEAKYSERDERHGLEAAAAAGALAAKTAEPEEPELEIPVERMMEDVPDIEKELATEEIREFSIEQYAEEVPEFQEEIAVEEETIESFIPVELEEPGPVEIEETPPQSAETATPESLVAVEGETDEVELTEGEEVISSPSPAIPFAASMGVGAVLYLAAMGGYLFLSLDAALVWALAILGSVMILFGFRRFYDVLLPVSEARKRNAGQ
ncbi:MAG: hypothetical protein GKC03_07945 [Methanomassiliicoccales archaeon]|nr:hypothetical protein [Methanomassiliicoccales archaeon]NYT15837.1 hypothetical protein [Methanomassiliicoccales archaeon]